MTEAGDAGHQWEEMRVEKANQMEVVFLPAKDFNQQITCYD
jgi:hypothetical protein